MRYSQTARLTIARLNTHLNKNHTTSAHFSRKQQHIKVNDTKRSQLTAIYHAITIKKPLKT